MIPELQNLGKILFDKLDSLKENVAIIISSDLAHTHLNNGPYGYSPAAEPFD
jgi:aromatic ring-opening dioxygenase LigB subunit